MRRLLPLLLFVACAAPPPPATAPTPTPAPVERGGSVWVMASTLNVRSEASADAAVVTRVRKGTKLDVVSEESGWLKVRLVNGDVGWVSAQHISRTQPATRRGGCPPDSDYSFVKTPIPAFSDRGAHGLVVVDATVNTKGEVTSTKVITNTTGDVSLAFLTEREIRSAKFAPPIRNCVPRMFIFTYKRSF